MLVYIPYSEYMDPMGLSNIIDPICFSYAIFLQRVHAHLHIIINCTSWLIYWFTIWAIANHLWCMRVGQTLNLDLATRFKKTVAFTHGCFCHFYIFYVVIQIIQSKMVPLPKTNKCTQIHFLELTYSTEKRKTPPATLKGDIYSLGFGIFLIKFSAFSRVFQGLRPKMKECRPWNHLPTMEILEDMIGIC